MCVMVLQHAQRVLRCIFYNKTNTSETSFGKTDILSYQFKLR